MSKTKTSASLGLLLAFTFLSGIVLSGPRAEAGTSVISNITLDIPITCAITPTDHTHSISIEPGHDAVIGSSTFTVTCNDVAGYSVYAVGYTNNTYGETNLVHNSNSSFVIPTGASASPTDSQWNMTLAPVAGIYAPEVVNVANGDNFTVPHVIPSTYTKVVYREESTDINTDDYTAVGSSFTAQYNLHVSNNQAAGLYTGKVKYTLVHPDAHATPETPIAVSGKICYYDNGADEGSMDCQSTRDINNSTNALSANANARLRASNFQRSGYGFTGWNTKEDGTGTQYGPMETITFTSDMNENGLVLFANWKAAETGVTMQSFSASTPPYSTMPNGSVIALRDERDNDVYAVAKLADGKWWMIENLRLDYDANITTTNTQSDSGVWGGVFAGLAEPEVANFGESTTPNSLYTNDTASTNLKVITSAYRFPRYNNNNTASPTANSTAPDANIYSYGNYYTWAAAIADTRSYTDNQSVTNTSLCPSGWHLPKGGDKSNEANNEWWSLIVNGVMDGVNPAEYTNDIYPYYHGNPEGLNVSKALRAYPNNLIFPGYYYYSSVSDRGSVARYWSSTAVGSQGAYFVLLGNDNVHPGTTSNYTFAGLTVRCLADSSSNQNNNQQYSPSNTPTNNQQSASPSSTSGTDGTRYLATTSNPVDEEDETNKSESSTNGNITPLGVKKSNAAEETASIIDGGLSSDAGVFGTVAAIGAAALVTGGIFLLAAKRRKDEDEEEE